MGPTGVRAWNPGSLALVNSRLDGKCRPKPASTPGHPKTRDISSTLIAGHLITRTRGVMIKPPDQGTGQN